MPSSRATAEREAERLACIREHGFDPRAERHPEAPRTRADCINGPRPCPWISCKAHLWLDIGKRGKLTRRSHVVKWHFRGLYECPSDMPPRASCALDLADDNAQHGMTLGEIGAAWRLHPERVRQIEVAALRKVRRHFRKSGVDASWLDALAVEVPESMFARAMDRAAQVACELDLDVELLDEAPASAARLLRVPRNGNGNGNGNGHSKAPTLALQQRMPTPTPAPHSTPTLRNHVLFLA